ncbi:lachesin-like [Aphis craccivora]|uniref:Lachesin-like n=1 Tax=Aphis craccivora TaxID=307492 RepID=A0A6G0VQI6_APHCR|nr:lachesin-like [Aphis craccivora]
MIFFNLPSSEKEAVYFLQERRVLPSARICPNNYLAKLYFGKEIFWKCNIKKCQKKVNIRNGNWFAKSRISFTTAVRFIYGWQGRTSA